ncbi:MAG TPA: hypothetical protein VH327_03220 [Gammaproteobacteria bacterium]|nr:hypothetical protein [Gammaproteobacteria bacterium]
MRLTASVIPEIAMRKLLLLMCVLLMSMSAALSAEPMSYSPVNVDGLTGPDILTW